MSRRRNPVGTSRRLQPGVEARDNECPPAVAFTLQRLSEKLLDSYSVERSEVGDHVLADAQRLTVIGAMRNPVGQYATPSAILCWGLHPSVRLSPTE